MLGDDRRYQLIRLDGPHPLTSIPWRGHRYLRDDSKKRRLVGWHPESKEHWFSDLLVRDGISRALTFYEPPTPGDALKELMPILPLDRLVEHPDPEALTPQIHKTWFISPLYKERMRKLKIGGIDLRLVLIAFGILAGILGLLYFSGYFK